jgi:hypothetical protein
VNPQDNPNSGTKARLMAELQTARAELRRARTLHAAPEPDPAAGDAVTVSTSEYESAANQYHLAVNNFADFILSQVGSEK